MAGESLVPGPPPPPRRTGDDAVDVANFSQWANDFYKIVVLGGYYLSTAQQSQAGDVGLGDLPDPASSTVAAAQETANQAYVLAALGFNLANQQSAKHVASGTITISDAAATGAGTAFSAAQPDTNYVVLMQPVEAATGSPAAGAYRVQSIAKTTAGFTITLEAAPGAGTSVTYRYLVHRG